VRRTALLVAAAVMAVLVVPWLKVSRVAAATPVTEQVCDPKADFFLGVENYPEAIRAHRALIEKRPGNALARYHLGFAYGMTGNKSAELREYREALALGLTRWDFFLNLGLAELDSGDLNAASDMLRVAVLLAPEHPEPHFNLGLVYERQGLLAEAEQQMLASLMINPTQVDARNMLGVIYARRGDSTRAAMEWRALLRDSPDYAPARANLALLAKKPPALAAWDASDTRRDVALTFASPPAH
jgi:tetratricopeptide (TPR) repeat protein